MTLYEFNQLGINNKAQFVWEQGLFIESTIENHFTFSLYSVSDFFVEFQLENNKIKQIKTFKKGIHLDKYLSKMNLTPILDEKTPE